MWPENDRRPWWWVCPSEDHRRKPPHERRYEFLQAENSTEAIIRSKLEGALFFAEAMAHPDLVPDDHHTVTACPNP